MFLCVCVRALRIKPRALLGKYAISPDPNYLIITNGLNYKNWLEEVVHPGIAVLSSKNIIVHL